MEAKWEHFSSNRGVANGSYGVHPQCLPYRQIYRRHLVSRQICSRPLLLVDVGMQRKFTSFERSLLCRQIGIVTPQKNFPYLHPCPQDHSYNYSELQFFYSTKKRQQLLTYKKLISSNTRQNIKFLIATES